MHAVQLPFPGVPYDAVAVPGGGPPLRIVYPESVPPPPPVQISQPGTMTFTGPPVTVQIAHPEPVALTVTTVGEPQADEFPPLPSPTIRTAIAPVASSRRVAYPPVLPTATQPVSLGPDRLLPLPDDYRTHTQVVVSGRDPWLDDPADEPVPQSSFSYTEWQPSPPQLDGVPEEEQFETLPAHVTITRTTTRQVTSESEV